MKRILLALATAALALTVQAQNIMICDPVMITQNGGTPQPVTGGKPLPVSVSAHNLVTATERFTGDGREQQNASGTFWTYREVGTGNMALLMFTRDSRVMLTVNMRQQNLVIMLQCYPQ
jgi:hypothetical protein